MFLRLFIGYLIAFYPYKNFRCFFLTEPNQVSGKQGLFSRIMKWIFSKIQLKNVLFFLLVFLVIAVLFFYYALIAEIIFSQFLSNQSISKFVPIIINAIFLIAGNWVFLKVTRFIISKHLENRGKKKEIKLILSLYSYIVWTLLVLLIASTIFKDIGIFLASLGLLGFGLTLALQKPILNFVGWLTIVVNKPFNVGDRIEVAGHRGDVIAIHSMYSSLQGTRVNSHEKSEKIITFPNEFILTNPVINYTKRVDLFWEDLTMQITFQSNWKKAEKILFDVTANIVKKHVSLPVSAMAKDKKSFEDALSLLKEASKKFSRGIFKQDLQEKIQTLKSIEQQSKEELPLPNIRVDLLESAIGLNVLFLADIRRIRDMRSEIAKNFLSEIEKHSDIKLAFPHRQIVLDNTVIRQNFGAKKVTDFV